MDTNETRNGTRNIFSDTIDKYKGKFYNLIYLVCFLLSLFFSIMFAFQSSNENINSFSYLYFVFSIGLIVLITIFTYFNDVLSLINLVFFVLANIFNMIKFFDIFSINSQYLQIFYYFTIPTIILSIAFLTFLLFFVYYYQNNQFYNVLGVILINFIITSILLSLSDSSLQQSKDANSSTSVNQPTATFSYYYAIYVFIYCVMYFYYYIFSAIQLFPNVSYFIQFIIFLLLFVSFIGIILCFFPYNSEGATVISPHSFLYFEFIPLYIVFFGIIGACLKQIFTKNNIMFFISFIIIIFGIEIVSFILNYFISLSNSSNSYIISQIIYSVFLCIFLLTLIGGYFTYIFYYLFARPNTTNEEKSSLSFVFTLAIAFHVLINIIFYYSPIENLNSNQILTGILNKNNLSTSVIDYTTAILIGLGIVGTLGTIFSFKSENKKYIYTIYYVLSLIILSIGWITYFCITNELSGKMFFLWNWLCISIMGLLYLSQYGYYLIIILYILAVLLLLGIILYFCNKFDAHQCFVYYISLILAFFGLIAFGIFIFVFSNYFQNIMEYLLGSDITNKYIQPLLNFNWIKETFLNITRFAYYSPLPNISYFDVFKYIIGAIIFFSMLSVGIHSNSFSANNLRTFIIVFIIVLVPIILLYLSNIFYTKSNENVSIISTFFRLITNGISTLISNFKNVMIGIALYLLLALCIYNLINHQVVVVSVYFLVYFIYVFCYILYYFKDYLSGNKEPQSFLKGVSISSLILFIFSVIVYYILRGIGWLVSPSTKTSDTSNSSTRVIYYVILFIFLCILYLYYKNNLSSSTNPYVNLFINIIFYIPCCFIDLLNNLTNTKNTYLMLLMIEILLIIVYIIFVYCDTSYVSQNGKVFIREPVGLNVSQNFTIPKGTVYDPSGNIIDPNKTNKPFGLSFWFFINSQNQSTNKYYSIVNYQNRPQILYNAYTNTLIVDVSGNEFIQKANVLPFQDISNNTGKSCNTVCGGKDGQAYPESTLPEWYNGAKCVNDIYGVYGDCNLDPIVDSSNCRCEATGKGWEPNTISSNVIFIQPHILLQKWNHMVINYSGSTMDIFMNGKLISSVPQIVPYIDSLLFSVGQNGGIDGGICNLIYFNHFLTLRSVQVLYNSVKDKNPPVNKTYWNSDNKKVENDELSKLKEKYKLENIFL